MSLSIATFERLCYYRFGNSVMYELSIFSIDRTFLLIYWDPLGANVSSTPYHLVAQDLSMEPTCLDFAGSILQDNKRHPRILPFFKIKPLIIFDKGFFSLRSYCYLF